MAFTEDLAKKITSTSLADFPQQAVDVATDILVDVVGCMLAGFNEPGTRIVRDYVLGQGKGPATIVGSSAGASPYMAAMANGTSAAILDYDDGSWRIIGHPSGCILPAVFALGEERGITGAQALEAYMVGYEVTVNIAKGTAPALYTIGRHTTGTIGVFGAAAACAKILALSEAQTRVALGIAASCSAALRAGHGTMTKGLHSGNAAAQGMMSARLAAEGMTAQDDIFEHRHGFFRAFGHGTLEPADIPTAWGNPWGFLEPDHGPGIKLIPSGTVCFCAAECALHIAATHRPAPSRIRRIVWRTSPAAMDVAPYLVPDDRNQAFYCLPWGIAAALVDGQVGLRQFDSDKIADPAIRALCARVELEVHPDLTKPETADFSAGELVVTLDDGRVLTHMRRRPRAYPGGEPWTREQLVAKFTENAGRCWPGRDVAPMLDAWFDIQRAGSLGKCLEMVRGA